MAEGAGDPNGNDAVRKAVQNAIKEERVSQLSDKFGLLASTANLGVRFVQSLLTVNAILVTIFIATVGWLLQQQFSLLGEVGDNRRVIEKQEASMQREFKNQARAIAVLKEKIVMLNTSLGEAPQLLRDAALAVREDQEHFRTLLSGLGDTSASLKAAKISLTAFKDQIGPVPAYVQQTHDALLAAEVGLIPTVNRMVPSVQRIEDEMGQILEGVTEIKKRLPKNQ